LILLLAACEQAAFELDETDIVVDALGEQLDSLSLRLHGLLHELRFET